MLNTKRLLIATLFGVIFGFVCWGFAASSGPQPWYFAVSTILARTLIGFTIGISVLKIPWWLHGIIIGGLYSLPGAFYGFSFRVRRPSSSWAFLLWALSTASSLNSSLLSYSKQKNGYFFGISGESIEASVQPGP